MKNIFIKLLFCVIGLCVTFTSMADTKAVFIMNIPAKMKLIREQEAPAIKYFSYIYSNKPLPADIYTIPESEQRMEIIAVNSSKYSPELLQGSSLQDYQAYGQMYQFLERYYYWKDGTSIMFNQNSVAKGFLAQAPQHFQINHQSFSLFIVTLDNTDAYFLGTTTRNTAYGISLTSIDSDPAVRKKQMDEMMASIGTIQLLGIPGLG